MYRFVYFFHTFHLRYIWLQQIADNFLAGNLKIEEFLDQFLSRRKTMHLRQAKAEKMSEIISRHLSFKGPSLGQQATSRINATSQNAKNFQLPNYSSAPVNLPYPTGNVPYPVGPLNMPMPNNYTPNHF